MKIPFSIYDFFGYLAGGLILATAIDFVFGSNLVLVDEMPFMQAVLLVVLSYILGHINAHLSSFWIEHVIVRKWLAAPEDILFSTSDGGKRVRRILFPIYYKPLPDSTKERVKARTESREFTFAPGRALFYHCHSVVKHDPTTAERLATFLYLYGFSRNASFAFFASGIALVVALAISLWREQPLDTTHLWVTVGCFAISIGMFYRYLKFFRHYTTEVFIVYAELKPEDY